MQPDIGAPGVNIIAAWNPPGDFSDISDAVHLSEMMPSTFKIMSGTSMATPHISGAAAFVKSMNPTWSPSAIRSALMTTGTYYVLFLTKYNTRPTNIEKLFYFNG